MTQELSVGLAISEAMSAGVRKQDIIRVIELMRKVKEERRTMIVQPRYDKSSPGLYIAMTEKQGV